MYGRNPSRIPTYLIHLIAIWLMILFIPSMGRAQLESTMPLEVGNSWTYASAADNLTITVTGTMNVLGRPAYRLVYDRGSQSLYEEYLSWNHQGQLLLHGRQGGTAPPVVFDPPLVWFTPGIEEGLGGTVNVYADLEGTTTPVVSTYYVAFMGEEVVAVPAGAYATTHVDELASSGEARWYTPDIGMAQLNYLHGGTATYRLVSHNMAVGVQKTSWSNLKAAYR